MNNFDLIDKYFENSLNPQERVAFNELLKTDQAFQDEFTFQKNLKVAIKASNQDLIKEKLQHCENKIQNKRKVLPLYKKWWFVSTIAASIVLLLWISFYNSPSPETIYVDHFKPYRNVVMPVVRGENNEMSIKQSAFVAYENGNYNKALHLFNDAPGLKKETSSFYQAMCYMALDKPTKAILLLKPIADSSIANDEVKNLNQLANWYLGLAYLNNNDQKNAKLQFQHMLDHQYLHYNVEEVKNILTQLK